MTIELVFPVRGDFIPTDHAYVLYAALSRIVPAFHEPQSPLKFGSINGTSSANGRLQLSPHSCLRIRLPDERIRTALPLAGKVLTVGDAKLRLGLPATRTLVSAPMLIARLATFKNADTPGQFLTTARVKLAEIAIDGEPQLPLHIEGERSGEPKRRVLRITDQSGTHRSIYGYSLLVTGLTADHSLRLQESGLGGRTQMGCGFFVLTPETTRRSSSGAGATRGVGGERNCPAAGAYHC